MRGAWRSARRTARFNPRPPLLAGDAPVPRRPARAWAMFQSAPAIAGGRCNTVVEMMRAGTSFNPRPPLLAGDAAARGSCRGALPRFNPRPPLLAGDAAERERAATVVDVSIRARHCWRAMRACPPACPRSNAFQSAPAIAGGRCGQAPALAAGGLDVSIRARHCWRAMRRCTAGGVRSLQFQSAPAIAGGRCRMPARTPATSASFNPRPPLLAGDAWRRRAGACFNYVSIRARHCWRAMLSATLAANTQPMFQSAPAIAGGRCRARSTEGAGYCRFNPRPPLLAGDAAAVWMPSNAKASFNPRPPLLAGDAGTVDAGCSGQSCFNPRPPLLAGDAPPFSVVSVAITSGVSIRARHCWRAMPVCQSQRGGYLCFNPRPPLLAGDAG